MAVVDSPVAGFTGEVVGVQFVDGHGQTDDESRLAYFRRHGYTVTTGKHRGKAKAAD